MLDFWASQAKANLIQAIFFIHRAPVNSTVLLRDEAVRLRVTAPASVKRGLPPLQRLCRAGAWRFSTTFSDRRGRAAALPLHSNERTKTTTGAGRLRIERDIKALQSRHGKATCLHCKRTARRFIAVVVRVIGAGMTLAGQTGEHSRSISIHLNATIFISIMLDTLTDGNVFAKIAFFKQFVHGLLAEERIVKMPSRSRS